MPDSVIKKVNAYGSKTKREVYGRDLEFLNRNEKKFDWDEEDDLNDMLGNEGFTPISLQSSQEWHCNLITICPFPPKKKKS